MTAVSVVIPTYRRAQYVRECLDHLSRLRTQPVEVLVIDASPDDETRAVVAEAADALPVRYLRNDLGAGTTPESRAIGVDAAVGDVVAFVDDDAFVDPDWLDELLPPYADEDVVGVGGRIVNGKPGEETEDLDRIGRLLPDGTLTGGFTADPGRQVDVDHLLGASMSYRRAALLDVGGVHGRYPGPCVCEESDIALRQRARGRRLVYRPSAVSRHVSAAPVKGHRFDRRWQYYARRNHVGMLVRIYGPRSPYVRRFVLTVLWRDTHMVRWMVRTMLRGRPDDRSVRARLRAVAVLARVAVDVAGLAVGLPAGLRTRALDRRGEGRRR